MSIKILSSSEYNVKLKCSIHSTGKLGFTDETIKHLNLDENSSITFAQDEENDSLYIILKKEMTKDSFKVNRAGNYSYVNAKPLFDRLGFDYRRKTYMFDMVETEIPEIGEDFKIYKLIKREKERKGKI